MENFAPGLLASILGLTVAWRRLGVEQIRKSKHVWGNLTMHKNSDVMKIMLLMSWSAKRHVFCCRIHAKPGVINFLVHVRKRLLNFGSAWRQCQQSLDDPPQVICLQLATTATGTVVSQ